MRSKSKKIKIKKGMRNKEGDEKRIETVLYFE